MYIYVCTCTYMYMYHELLYVPPFSSLTSALIVMPRPPPPTGLTSSTS